MAVVVGIALNIGTASYIAMRGKAIIMKLGDLLGNIAERDAKRLEYRKLDKLGRLYFGPNEANKEYLVALIEPIPEDKMKFLKVGRGSD